MSTEIHEDQEILTAGSNLEDAEKAVILLHGRGATAQGILQLENQLKVNNTSFFAPQAAQRTWYPNSFLQPRENNQPHLKSALKTVNRLVERISKELSREKIVIAGFSQGACLATEYAASEPEKFGGVIGFSGGLIGKELPNYTGDLEDTPVFLGCAENDPHIPLERVEETEKVFRELNANVEKHIFEGSYHGIVSTEIEKARQLVKNV